MNIDAKILNRLCANQVQQYIKKTVYHNLVHFRMQGWFNICKSITVIQCKNKIRDKKNHMIILIDTEKVIDKIQHSFMIKALKKPGIDRMYLDIIKDINDKLIAKVMLNGEKLKALPPKPGISQGVYSLYLYSIECLNS
jgi:hypothetical protein